MAKFLFIFGLLGFLTRNALTAHQNDIKRSLFLAPHLLDGETSKRSVSFQIENSGHRDDMSDFVKDALDNIRKTRNKRAAPNIAPTSQSQLIPDSSVVCFYFVYCMFYC